MSEPEQPPSSSMLARLSRTLFHRVDTREELDDTLEEALERHVIDQDAFEMVNGVLAVNHLQARDIMIPRSKMIFIEKDESLQDFLPKIIASGHSRFPVIGEDKDDVIGILLAKDLLSHLFHQGQSFQIRDYLRPVFFVPQSKRLNVLLREFRVNRNHLAVVVDEYGGVCGLVTIEDILEEIVGEITDEHDQEIHESYIRKQDSLHYSVDALTPIEVFNEFFGVNFSDEESDTVGGMVMQAFGHLPQKNETIDIDQFQFDIQKADDRRIVKLRVKRVD